MNKTHKYNKFHKKTTLQNKIIKENNFTYKILIDLISKYLKYSQDILDIGCGSGTLDFYLANKGNKIYGIDISEKAISICQESAKILKLKKNTIFKVMNFPKQIPARKFDFVIFTEVLEHLKEEKLALEKIYSLLKSNGILFISVPSKNSPLYRLGLAYKFDNKVGHLRRYSTQEIINMLKRYNFKIIEVNKTEGILRNFLFINPIACKINRFIKFFIADIVTFIDNILIRLFGESDIIIVAKRIE